MRYRSKMSYHSKLNRNIADLKYRESEKGYFYALWSSIKYVRNVPYSIKDRDHLLELWNNHKKEYGPYCRYTGIPLTTKRSTGEGWKRGRPTNISIARLDPRRP